MKIKKLSFLLFLLLANGGILNAQVTNTLSQPPYKFLTKAGRGLFPDT